MIKAVIFDLDRTLFNIDIPEERALSSVHTHFVPEHIEIETFINTYKIENEKWWRKRSKENATLQDVRLKSFVDLFDVLEITMPKPVEYISSHYITEAQKHWVLYPDVIDTLESLQQRDIKIGLVTNGFSTVQHPKLEAMDLKKYFDVLTISDEVGFAKPDHRIFDHCIDGLKVDRDKVIYVGDNLHDDYQGAKNAGIQFLWFNEHGQQNNDHVPEFNKYHNFISLIDTF